MNNNNRRIVQGTRNAIFVVLKKLKEAGNRAEPVLLTLRESSILITFIEAAHREARRPRGRPTLTANEKALRAWRHRARVAEAAFEAAERKLFDMNRSAVSPASPGRRAPAQEPNS